MTQKKANWILATVSLAWGLSYLLMKLGVQGIPPFNMTALRCGIAFLVTALVFFPKIRKVDVKTLKYSAISGALLCGLFTGLLYGLQSTTASSAGFLTSTTVIMVPIFLAVITRKLPNSKIMLGVIVVSAGLLLLTSGDRFALDIGSMYCLAAALLYAIHIIVSNRFVREVDSLQLGIYQLGFAALFASVGMLVFEQPVLPSTPVHWVAVLGLALICSAYGFVMQSITQKYTTPESVGFLFSLEPVFSALFAFVFLNEIMGLQGYIGAGLILMGVFIANQPARSANAPAQAHTG
ncbi:DMT family transporter [Paenibacillus medicaginis]|uniref:DMT family transporter n=1 Tax=Paenibacillus medicaginis TaxID=1470560 RepID=A0ABV5CA87_9BACL